MDGERLLSNLLTLKGRELRIIYAFLAKTPLSHLLSTLSKSVLSKDDCSYLTDQVISKAAVLDNRDDEDVQLDLLQELCRVMGRDHLYIRNADHLKEVCEELVLEVHLQLVKQDKLYAEFVRKAKDESKLDQLLDYQLNRLITEMDLYLKEEPKNRQATYYTMLYSSLHSLSINQRDELKKGLRVKDVSPESVLPKLMELGTKESIELLKPIAGLTVYEAIPPMLYFLTKKQDEKPSNRTEVPDPYPDFLLSSLLINPFILNGRALLVNYHHQSIKKRLMPFFLLQISFSSLIESQGTGEADRLIDLWKSRYVTYKDLHLDSNLLEMKHIETTHSLQKADKKLTEIEKRLLLERKIIQEEKGKIMEALTYIDTLALTISDHFTSLSEQYEKSQRAISEIESLKRSDRLETSVMKQVSTKLLNMTASLDVLSEKKRSEQLLSQMVEEILASEANFKNEEKRIIKRCHSAIAKLTDMKKTGFIEKERYRAMLSEIESEQKGVMKKLYTLEKTNKAFKEWMIAGEE